jgi:mannose-6-phosphate isomerase-like protein (cupin superfamily)
VTDVRRVVAENGAGGRSRIAHDGPCPNIVRPPSLGGVAIGQLWQTDATAGDIAGTDDRGLMPVQLQPPAHGTAFRLVEFPPDAALAMPAGEGGSFLHGAAVPDAHAMMHQTATVDYAIVLSGECYLVVDDGEVLLRAGDTAVQRGVRHRWSNRSAQPARIAFILVDAQ